MIGDETRRDKMFGDLIVISPKYLMLAFNLIICHGLHRGLGLRIGLGLGLGLGLRIGI
jgi:hypothetical protein